MHGFDYILNHFDQPLWPRTVSTMATQGRQVIVNSTEEVLAYFKAANYYDCKVSAYPYWRPSSVSSYVGLKNAISPNFIMIDLDICNFEFDDSALKAALRKTLRRIKGNLGVIPTVFWSGNGYHVYISIDAVVLEDINQFAHIEKVSTKFLRFAEWYLSSGKSDSAHNTTVSLNNCMLRVPGSLNGKNNTRVSIIKEWNGYRPNINLLLGSFCVYLKDQRIKELQVQRNRTATPSQSKGDAISIQWIEELLRTPIHDSRKFAIWRILAPYLINVKKLSEDEASVVIENWLNECHKLNRLNFYSKAKIKEGLRGATKDYGYYPLGLDKLKNVNGELYSRFHI